jgi:hypothetical protein
MFAACGISRLALLREAAVVGGAPLSSVVVSFSGTVSVVLARSQAFTTNPRDVAGEHECDTCRLGFPTGASARSGRMAR